MPGGHWRFSGHAMLRRGHGWPADEAAGQLAITVLERTVVSASAAPPSAHERRHDRHDESKACEAFDADAGVRRSSRRIVAQCKPPVGSGGAHPSIIGCTVQEFSGRF